MKTGWILVLLFYGPLPSSVFCKHIPSKPNDWFNKDLMVNSCADMVGETSGLREALLENQELHMEEVGPGEGVWVMGHVTGHGQG